MSFTERNITVMHAELKAVCKCVCKLIMVREVAGSYRLEEMDHLRLRENLEAWRQSYGFDRWNAHDGW